MATTAKTLLLILDFDQTLTKKHTCYDEEAREALLYAKTLTEEQIKENIRHPLVMRAIINAFHQNNHMVGIASFNDGTEDSPGEWYIHETLQTGLPGINLEKIRIRAGLPDAAIVDEFGKTFYYSEHIDDFNHANELEKIDVSKPADCKRVIVVDDDIEVIKLARSKGYTAILMPSDQNDITPYLELADLGGLKSEVLAKVADEILRSNKPELKQEAEFIGRLVKALAEREKSKLPPPPLPVFAPVPNLGNPLGQGARKVADLGNLSPATYGFQSLDPNLPVPPALGMVRQTAGQNSAQASLASSALGSAPAAQNKLPMEEIITLAGAMGLTPAQFMKQQKVTPLARGEKPAVDNKDNKDNKERKDDKKGIAAEAAVQGPANASLANSNAPAASNLSAAAASKDSASKDKAGKVETRAEQLARLREEMQREAEASKAKAGKGQANQASTGVAEQNGSKSGAPKAEASKPEKKEKEHKGNYDAARSGNAVESDAEVAWLAHQLKLIEESEKAAKANANANVADKKASLDGQNGSSGSLVSDDSDDLPPLDELMLHDEDKDEATLQLALRDSLESAASAVIGKAEHGAIVTFTSAAQAYAQPTGVLGVADSAAAKPVANTLDAVVGHNPPKGPNFIDRVRARNAEKKEKERGKDENSLGLGGVSATNTASNASNNVSLQQRAGAVVSALEKKSGVDANPSDDADKEAELEMLTEAMELSDPTHDKLYYLANLRIERFRQQQVDIDADIAKARQAGLRDGAPDGNKPV